MPANQKNREPDKSGAEPDYFNPDCRNKALQIQKTGILPFRCTAMRDRPAQHTNCKRKISI